MIDADIVLGLPCETSDNNTSWDRSKDEEEENKSKEYEISSRK